MILNFRRNNVSNLISKLNESVKSQRQLGHPPIKSESLPVTKRELLNFVKVLQRGFNDISEDLENLRKEMGRMKK